MIRRARGKEGVVGEGAKGHGSKGKVRWGQGERGKGGEDGKNGRCAKEERRTGLNPTDHNF